MKLRFVIIRIKRYGRLNTKRRTLKRQNGIDIPVIIFKGEFKLGEFPSIQLATHWCKQYLNDNRLRFSAVSRGIKEGKDI